LRSLVSVGTRESLMVGHEGAASPIQCDYRMVVPDGQIPEKMCKLAQRWLSLDGKQARPFFPL
jgi:hypothetical protein